MAEWHCRPAGCMEPSMMLETFLCLHVEGLGQIFAFNLCSLQHYVLSSCRAGDAEVGDALINVR